MTRMACLGVERIRELEPAHGHMEAYVIIHTMFTYIYIYIYMRICVCVYIYICTDRFEASYSTAMLGMWAAQSSLATQHDRAAILPEGPSSPTFNSASVPMYLNFSRQGAQYSSIKEHTLNHIEDIDVDVDIDRDRDMDVGLRLN